MTVAAVVLAAGGGRRYGGPKAAAMLEGRPLVAHAVQAAVDAGLDRIVVVVGAAAEEVSAAVPRHPGVRIVVNTRWDEGQSTSLRAGLTALADDAEVAVILLADQPRVEPRAITAVVEQVRDGAEAARVVYDDRPSHPVAVARRVWPALRGLTGDAGARQVFDDLDVRVVRLAGPAPLDVDVADDLETLRHGRGRDRDQDPRPGD